MRAWPLDKMPRRELGSYNRNIVTECNDCKMIQATLWVETQGEMRIDPNIPPGTIILLDKRYAKSYMQLCEPCYTLRVLGENA